MAGEACMDIKLIGKVTVRQKLQVLSLYTLTYTNAIYTYIYVIKACQGIMWRLTLLGWKMTFLPLMDEVRAVPHIPLAIHGVLLKSINLSGVHCSAVILYPEKILVSNLSSCFLSSEDCCARVYPALFSLFSLKTSFWRCWCEVLVSCLHWTDTLQLLSFLFSAPDGPVNFLFLGLAGIAMWLFET